ncbi:MAG: hypothetical protein Kow0077_08890 [Anaerolineae bacterium]
MSEFEALVSHVYMVGGRSVNTPPSGALVQLCPPGAPRSRERDAFFVLVTAGGTALNRPVFYEKLARWASERYFERSGGVTAALQAVLESLNENLFQHNARHPAQTYYAHMVCLVLRGQEVFVAKTDGTGVLFWQGGGLRRFPQAGPLAGTHPLGMAPEPDFQVTRFIVEAGDVMALTDNGLFSLAPEALRQCGVRGDIQQTAQRLKQQRVVETSAMLLQFVPPEVPVTAESAPALESQAAQGGAVAPAVNPVPAQTARPSVAQPVQSRHVAPAGREESALKAQLEALRERGQQGQQTLASAASAARPVLDEIQSESRNVFLRLARRLLALVNRGLLGVAGGLGRVRSLLDKLLPEPEPGKPPSLPTPVAAAAAILVPVAVVLLVVAVSLNTRDETVFERCLSQAREAAGAAELIEQTSPEEAQQAWFGVIDVANRCLARRPNDPVLREISEQAQLRLDRYAQVVRCPAVPLQDYPPGTILRGPILRSDVDLYTVDVSRGVLYRDRLNDTGTAILGESEVLARRGMSIDGLTVRDMVDIAWLTEGTVARSSVLVALDKSGVLITYSPTFPPAEAQRLIGSERWVNPVAVDTWQGRLYILDPVANQIWRYQPAGGTFPSAPEEYFVGDDRPDISAAVDFAIDLTGNIFVLQADGSVRKFYAGEEQFFQFSNLPSGAVGRLGRASTFYLDTGFISPGFYVVDADNEIVHETTLGGTFIRSYRAPIGMQLRDLGGLAVDTSAENIYVTARDVLYHIPKCVN